MTLGLISVWCNTLFSIGIQTTADPYIALVWIVIKQSSVCTSVRDLHSTHAASTCTCCPFLCEWKRSQGAPVAASLSGCFMDVSCGLRLPWIWMKTLFLMVSPETEEDICSFMHYLLSLSGNDLSYPVK